MASNLLAMASNLLGIQAAAAESRKRLYARTSGTTATAAFFCRLQRAHRADQGGKVYIVRTVRSDTECGLKLLDILRHAYHRM